MKKRNRQIGMLLLGVGLVMPPMALAGDAGTTTPTAHHDAKNDIVQAANVVVVNGDASAAPTMTTGMVIAIDPVTGERRAPSADERADLSAASRFGKAYADDASLHQFSVEGGGVGLLLDSRYVISEAITLNADGTWTEHHQTGLVSTIEALEAAIAAVPATTNDDAIGSVADDRETKEAQ